MKLPHPIPYQGSKRNLADQILRYFPNEFCRLIEPFAGSAAITIASAFYFKANHFIINDINEPLIHLWDKIINNPQTIIKQYHDIWHGQIGNEDEYYFGIREKFNETHNPEYLLFLLAKCVKAAVRYNSLGGFNQSHDKRRLGRNPQLMRDDILRVSHLLKNKTKLYSFDYSMIFNMTDSNDLVYMDPPYQGTGLNGGFNYSGKIELTNFILSLFDLNRKNVPFILSFDGRTGDKTYGSPLPEELNLTKIEVNAGRSSQATLLNRKEITYEAIYLSPTLIAKIDFHKLMGKQLQQTNLFVNMSKKVPIYPPEFLAHVKSINNKRAKIVIDHIMLHGFITTEDLEKTYGYSHPPRAARDVRETGIPLETFKVKSKEGKSIAAYKFGDISKLQLNKVDGRILFPKEFKKKLSEQGKGKCFICNGEFEDRYLQVDHRVPYEIGGDTTDTRNIGAFMLLCGSCNRAKSWSCEHCDNWNTQKNPSYGLQCYWGQPTNYNHIALKPIRRMDLHWNGDDVKFYDAIKVLADHNRIDMPSFVKKLIAARAKQ